MIAHYHINIDFEPYSSGNPKSTDVFVYEGRMTSINWPLGKLPKRNEGRQGHFERQLKRLADAKESRCLPIFIQWRTGQRNQMDKGCIGHSFGPHALIQSVAVNHLGQITHVILRDENAQN